MSNFHNEAKAFLEAITFCDVQRVRSILAAGISIPFNELDESPLHLICKSSQYVSDEDINSCDNSSKANLDLIYMLLDSGADIEKKDEDGNTCLFYAVQRRNHDLCHVLLQCGADMWANTMFGIPIYDYVSQLESSCEIKDIFNQFYPGLWKAVVCEDIYQVRKLINLWCRTNLSRNGITLKDVAFQTGNEEIISLVLGINESMELVYHILAKNIGAVQKLLETCKKKLRLDLRKMSDRGAPILYYLIQSRYVPAIELFIKHGCQIYTIMQDGLGYDMPVLFSALQQDMSANVLEALLPKNKVQLEDILYKILYKGKTVLEVALEQNVSIEIFNLLIDRGGPLLLCERNQINQTVRDIAVLLNLHDYVDAIDKTVNTWIYDADKHPSRREQLALYGWQFEDAQIEHQHKECNDTKEFLSHLKAYQNQIKSLSGAVERGDVSEFIELKNVVFEFSSSEKKLLWNGRIVGDGMPLLHRAVLYNRLEIVEIILNEKLQKESIDNLFDQNHRTALHYAYARSVTNGIRKLLLDCGCSEHVLDKMNKEPLDFRDKQDHPLMLELINRLKLKDFLRLEPDPWKDRIDSEDLLLIDVACHQDECEIRAPTHNRLYGESEEEESEYYDEDSSYEEEERRKFCLIA